MVPAVEIPLEKWSGKVREVTLGGGKRKSVVAGGQPTLPFLRFEGSFPHRPLVAVEIQDVPPQSWPQSLTQAWGDALQDPALWARKTVELGADLVVLALRSAHPEEGNTGAAEATQTVSRVLEAVDLPLVILGPEVPEKDNEVLVAVADAARGERVALGFCVEKNYRTIAAACMANGHVAIAKTPIEINLAKQLNVLISDLGLPLDSIIMDPTTGALGYGLEYSYSVIERLRLAALQGDGMTAMPIFCTVGAEAWRQKEARATEGVPQAWGEQGQRAIVWEEITAISLLTAGADIVVLRHPQSVAGVKAAIHKLMG